eukprot:537186-Pelagomonas_calceolata.AAC.2
MSRTQTGSHLLPNNTSLPESCNSHSGNTCTLGFMSYMHRPVAAAAAAAAAAVAKAPVHQESLEELVPDDPHFQLSPPQAGLPRHCCHCALATMHFDWHWHRHTVQWRTVVHCGEGHCCMRREGEAWTWTLEW